MILVDGAGVVQSHAGRARPEGRIAGLDGWPLPGESLLTALAAQADRGDGDARAVRLGLEAVLSGRQAQFEHLSSPAGWRLCITAVVPAHPVAAVVRLEPSTSTQAHTDRLYSALTAAERRLGLLQTVAGLGSWHAEVGTQAVQFSPEAYQVLGIDPAGGAITSELIRERVHPEDLAGVRADAVRMYAGEPLVTSRFRFRRDDGSLAWLESRVTLVAASADRPAGVVGTVRDISDAARAQRDLERHRDRLEDLVVSRTVQLAEASERADSAGRVKRAFLTHASHEIRSPLNVIVSLAHLLQQSTSTPPHSAWAQAILQAARHLSSIIDDVLDLARSESTRLALRSQSVQPAQVVDEVLAMLRPQAEARGLRLESEPPTPADGMELRGDAARLRQALLNAVRWAIGAAPGGRVSIGVHIEVEPDAGVGLNTTWLAHLRLCVDSEAPVDAARWRTDLELQALRQLMELMQGSAELSARPEGGSECVLRVSMPLPDDPGFDTPSQTGIVTAQLRQRHAGRRVLLAEDDEINQLAMLELLADVGLLVDTADDGRDAVDMAVRRPYALIILDLRMPRMDGVSAARTMRALPDLRETPLVAITANAFDEDRQACRAAGMNDFLAKPVDVQQLYEVLLRWLDHSIAAEPPPRAVAPGPRVPSPADEAAGFAGAPAWASSRPQAPGSGVGTVSATPTPNPTGLDATSPSRSPVRSDAGPVSRRPAQPRSPDAASGDAPEVAPMVDPGMRGLLMLEGVDALGGLASVGGRPAVYRRLLAVFVTTHAEDGADLRALLRDGQTAAAGSLAHRVRGSAATLGLIDIETAAGALEAALDAGEAADEIDRRAASFDQCLSHTLRLVQQALAR
jgi:PAS domain S-box-containing protein